MKASQQIRTLTYKKMEEGVWSSLYLGLKAEEPWHSLEVESQEVTGQLFEQDTDESNQFTVQLQQKFIVTSIKHGLIVVHQNNAHSRIIYERLLRMATLQDQSSQPVLFTDKIDLSSAQRLCAEVLQEPLASMGFDLELNSEQMEIKAIPASLEQADAKAIILTILDDEMNNRPNEGFSLLDTLARKLASKMAIKTGQKLSLLEQRELINELFACKEPDRSPEQKRTFITLNVNEIDQNFHT